MRRPVMTVVSVVAVLVLAGCGEDSRTDGDAQPAPAGTSFRDGVFDALPMYPRAEPVGSLSVKDGVTARSFATTRTTPERVVRWYRDALIGDGWRAVEGPHAVGASAWRVTLRDPSHELLVSAGPAPAIGNREGPSSVDEIDVQFSLSLSEA